MVIPQPQMPPANRTFSSLPEQPLVSVIVPSFNQGRFIRATIDSILQQDYRPLEVIVVDGGSRDETVAVLRSYGDLPELLWTSEPDRGVADAVNKGFSRARGNILAIQSSDDCYLPEALRDAVQQLQRSPELALIYADLVTVDEQGQELYRSGIGEYSLVKLLTKQTWIPQPTAFFRAEVLQDLRGWNDRYFNCDTEFWLRLAFRYPIRKQDQMWAQRRLHGEQRNTKAREIVDSYRRMVEESSDLQAGPSSLRRAARCGAHLHAMRYNPGGSSWSASMALWRAIAAYPRIFPHVWRSPLLIPGRLPLAVCRNRVGRMLRGRLARHMENRKASAGGDAATIDKAQS